MLKHLNFQDFDNQLKRDGITNLHIKILIKFDLTPRPLNGLTIIDQNSINVSLNEIKDYIVEEHTKIISGSHPAPCSVLITGNNYRNTLDVNTLHTNIENIIGKINNHDYNNYVMYLRINN